MKDSARCRQSPAGRLRRFLLAVFVAVLTVLGLTALSATATSAATASAAQTRVGPHTLVAQVVVGPGVGIGAGQRLGNDVPAYNSALATGVAAKSVPKGIIYRRTDLLDGKPYIGQAKSESGYLTRQSEHARAHPDADFEFEIIGRSNRGVELDRMEEFFIRGGGGPTNLGNPRGGWRTCGIR